MTRREEIAAILRENLGWTLAGVEKATDAILALPPLPASDTSELVGELRGRAENFSSHVTWAELCTRAAAAITEKDAEIARFGTLSNDTISTLAQRLTDAVERAETAERKLAEAAEALRAADQFITNGIELGFIRMPDADTPDAAHKTPGLVKAARAALEKDMANG